MQPQKSNTTLIVVIVVLCVVVPCALLIGVGSYFVRQVGQNVSPMIGCMLMYEGVRDAVEEYALANEGKMPPATSWQDDIRPFYAKWREKSSKDSGPFKPPAADSEWSCKFGDRVTGIAYNSDLQGKKWEEIENRRKTVLIYEIDQVMKNANGPFKERSKKGSPQFMGEERGWLSIPVEGSMDNIDFGN